MKMNGRGHTSRGDHVTVMIVIVVVIVVIYAIYYYTKCVIELFCYICGR